MQVQEYNQNIITILNKFYESHLMKLKNIRKRRAEKFLDSQNKLRKI
jgi:hypothetical protein